MKMSNLPFVRFCLAFCCWLSWLSPSLAKVVSGDFRLSGLNTEYVLGSFAISANKQGSMLVKLTSKAPYQMNKDVFVRLIRDDKWPDYQKAPSCTDKVPFSMTDEHLVQQKKHKNYVAEIAMPIINPKDQRSHYYYFVITDCSLEYVMHDDAVPELHYELQAWNNGSHVSADETHLKMLHTVTLIFSGILSILLGMTIMIQLYEKSTVHAAMFWVMAAATCDTFSSMFEIVHLSIYSQSGVGSYGLDCISAHLEAICDSLVALLLLSIAAGWTLPSDVIAVQQNASMVQRLLGGLQSPFGALRSFSPTAMLAIAILLSHVVLAQWGRIYNDDFDSYHDLEHMPGKLLMALRILLGLCLLICCFQTKSRCPASLHGFYLKLAIVGTLWFQSLPVLTWVVNTVVPYHLRHWTVGMWGAGLQTSGIVLLSWLVTSHSTSYHKLSHLSSAKENLTDSLTSASTTADEPVRTWKMGKAKVRLD
jgi:hypothetical protein